MLRSQPNIGTGSKSKLGNPLRDGVECVIMGLSERMIYRSEMNWKNKMHSSKHAVRCQLTTMLTNKRCSLTKHEVRAVAKNDFP